VGCWVDLGMPKTELKKNITKIEQLLQSENYEAGFELLMTLNNSELTKALMEKIISCLITHLKEHDIEDVLKLSMELNVLRPFQLHIGKISSIDSSEIELLYKRDDLDEATRKIVELKYSLSELHKKHLQDNQGFDSVSEISDEQWINDSEISNKNLGEIIFGALYRDDNKKLVLAVTKNPHFPSVYLKELYELHHDKFDLDSYRLYLTWIILRHSNCPETVLEIASNKNEGYCSSLIRKAVALNKNTNKKVIDLLLKDQYRWVRQAAASHSSLKINDILKLIETGDRYILKGLKENTNCDTNVIKKITTLLEDEVKYPLEYTTYSVTGCVEPGRACAGVIPIDIIVALIKSDYVFPEGLYDLNEGYETWTTFDNIYYADGAFDGPGSEICINDRKNNTEEEYIEIGNDIGFGGESPDITKFHNSEYDPSYFKSLEVGTFFHNTTSYHEGSVEFEPIEQEDELKIWELTRKWRFGLFSTFDYSENLRHIYFEGDWTHEISDYSLGGTLYVKTGEDSFSAVEQAQLTDEISKELGDDIRTTQGDEDAITLYLKNKYKGK